MVVAVVIVADEVVVVVGENHISDVALVVVVMAVVARMLTVGIDFASVSVFGSMALVLLMLVGGRAFVLSVCVVVALGDWRT